VRHLGVVYDLSKTKTVKEVALIEMVARVAKSQLRAMYVMIITFNYFFY
jgi:hypothetical protein